MILIKRRLQEIKNKTGEIKYFIYLPTDLIKSKNFKRGHKLTITYDLDKISIDLNHT